MVRPNRCGFDELRHGYGGITPQPATDGSAREDKTGQLLRYLPNANKQLDHTPTIGGIVGWTSTAWGYEVGAVRR